ncbi:MAG: aminotransferase class III-fold pyridoxal phosphate-dependent enzyme [Actinomycetia bacterium]|nr:aminotransferase class III-fold pyridoxal phosphate-dependent enzyme [Actinomycetes bacterium]
MSTTDTESETRILEWYRDHLSKGRATLAELFGRHMEVASEGAWLWTADGERFLNCGGYGVFIMGARHPAVMEAVLAQLGRHPISTRILLEPAVGRAAHALTAIAPVGLDRVHFVLSGAEAVETAIKLARANGRRHIVSAHHGYHGKTLGALSATAEPVYQQPFRPLLPDVTHVPYGDAPALEQVLARHPGDCCVIVEPVQGEGGVVIPPPGWLREVATLCRCYGALLVLDEVQTGMGRLGARWGADLEGVVPDILLAGKALGGGVLPVAAAITNQQVYRPFDRDPYLHTSTFSGAPVLMAAVRGAVEALERDGLAERAARLGAVLRPELARIAAPYCPELVVDVRGRGLLIGIEYAEPGLAGEMLIELFNHGVIANHSMNRSSTVRFTPPAVLTDADVEYLLDAFGRASSALVAGRARPEGRR